jgi:hypothetical protein
MQPIKYTGARAQFLEEFNPKKYNNVTFICGLEQLLAEDSGPKYLVDAPPILGPLGINRENRHFLRASKEELREWLERVPFVIAHPTLAELFGMLTYSKEILNKGNYQIRDLPSLLNRRNCYFFVDPVIGDKNLKRALSQYAPVETIEKLESYVFEREISLNDARLIAISLRTKSLRGELTLATFDIQAMGVAAIVGAPHLDLVSHPELPYNLVSHRTPQSRQPSHRGR